MPLTMMRSFRTRAALGVLVLLLGLLVVRGRPAQSDEVPALIRSDSVPDPAAVGMCARGRASGVVEGEIVGIVELAGDPVPRFRIRGVGGQGEEYLMTAAAVQVVSCEPAPEARERVR